MCKTKEYIFKNIIIICFLAAFFNSHGYAAEEPIANDNTPNHSLVKYNNALRPSDELLHYLRIDPQTTPDTAFHTDKVYLRLIERSDKAAIINLYADKTYMKYYPEAINNDNASLKFMLDYVISYEKKIENGASFRYDEQPLMFAICQLTDGAIVGIMEVFFIRAAQHRHGDEYIYTASLDYAIDKKHSGAGYATDAVKIITSFLRRSPYLACACTQVIPENKASIKVLKNNGFRYYRTQKKYPNNLLSGYEEYSLTFSEHPLTFIISPDNESADKFCNNMCGVKQHTEIKQHTKAKQHPEL